MPRLNWVFEELGIHHGEHVVPSKVLASIEKKKQKAAVKNATVAAESKKRKVQAGSKTLSKKQKIEATSIVRVGKIPDTQFLNPNYLNPDPKYPNPNYPIIISDSDRKNPKLVWVIQVMFSGTQIT
jgi:hypothetical protein